LAQGGLNVNDIKILVKEKSPQTDVSRLSRADLLKILCKEIRINAPFNVQLKEKSKVKLKEKSKVQPNETLIVKKNCTTINNTNTSGTRKYW